MEEKVLKLEEIEVKLKEIPIVIEKLKSEHNQLLGYQAALLDVEKEKTEESSKEKKKSYWHHRCILREYTRRLRLISKKGIDN